MKERACSLSRYLANPIRVPRTARPEVACSVEHGGERSMKEYPLLSRVDDIRHDTGILRAEHLCGEALKEARAEAIERRHRHGLRAPPGLLAQDRLHSRAHDRLRLGRLYRRGGKAKLI